MSANETKLKELIAVFVIIVLGLAFTPSVASMVTNASYIPYTETAEIKPLVANSTVTTYTARNDSTTYAYFQITLNDTAADTGLTTIDEAKNITYTVSSKTLTFKVGVLDDGKVYNASISYSYLNPNGAIIAILPIVPILWVVMILAVGIVTISVIIKKGG
jgi:hypothetical protein